MIVKSYQDLIVWQKSMELAFEVYQLSKYFPKDELYGLTNQLRRAVVSIPSNIAEGKSRNSKAEYLHLISIAQGSLAETETQILLAIRLEYITEKQAKNCMGFQNEISKMLSTLRSKLYAFDN
jgi:four helix bundle protein